MLETFVEQLVVPGIADMHDAYQINKFGIQPFLAGGGVLGYIGRRHVSDDGHLHRQWLLLLIAENANPLGSQCGRWRLRVEHGRGSRGGRALPDQPEH